MAEQTSLSLLLKRYRLAAGFSQEALAQRAELSARAISDLERGLHRMPHSATLDVLATALALSSQQRALLLAAARPEMMTTLSAPGTDGSDTSANIPQGLPTPPATLIGREHEVARAVGWLSRDTMRLVTLTGPSGVGKTRLALQIAHDSAALFHDGVAFVDLAPVEHAALVPGAIAQALRMRVQRGMPLDQQIRSHLRDRRMLLLLDNFEQVIESALFVAELLQWCPRLSCLVTSRSPLRLRGEHTLPLDPLPLEDAIVLFRERAHAMRPDDTFAVSEAAAICERVDCLPLAVELAACQVTIASLPEILEQLNHHMTLTFEGARDLPLRQRTMEAAIGWSYDLLSASQQRCFRALGAFVGGMTLDAARAVCWGDGTVTKAEMLLTIASLVDANLVRVEMTPGESTRFYMLELVREYAQNRLRAEGDEEAYRRCHAAYFAALAESLMSSGFGFGGAESLARELPNVRAALEWAEARRDAVLGLKLAGFARLWSMRGMAEEAERWLAVMLALDADELKSTERAKSAPTASPGLRVVALYGYARTLLNHGNLEKATTIAQEAVALAQQLNDQEALSDAYATLGLIAQASGDIAQATSAFAESAKHASLDVPSETRYHALFFQAEAARNQGHLDQAHALLERTLEGAKAVLNMWDCAIIDTMLAHVECQQQVYTRARQRYLDSLSQFHAFGASAFFAWCLEGYCALLCAEGKHLQATRLSATAAALRLQAAAPLPIAERAGFERTLASARVALGQIVFDNEWGAGSALMEAEALDEAMKSGF